MSRALSIGSSIVVMLAVASAVLADPVVPELGSDVQKFVKFGKPVIAITHVRVIDGTGTPALVDQTVVINRGKIATIGSASIISVPAGATIVDGTTKTLIPGLVGMHDHMFYIVGTPAAIHMMYAGFPRLYLAAGVTTIRTTGSVEPYADLNTKREIDAGRALGPNIDVSGPYVSGPGSKATMSIPRSPEEVTEMVNYFANVGITSFKAHAFATRSSLRALIEAAHKRGLKVAGHLCAVTFHEAVEMGIDSLEHGLQVATDFVPGKKTDECPSGKVQYETLAKLDVESTPVQKLIRELVDHHVAITSTLGIIETYAPKRFPPQQRMLDLLDAQARLDYLAARNDLLAQKDPSDSLVLKKEMQFERDFVKAGGLLMAGSDPTGYGGTVAGLGDQRGLELLVEAGFTPEEAIKIATSNGAQFEGRLNTVGTIAIGKNADLVLIDGNPSLNIADVEHVEVVFKNGIGFDSAKIFEAMKGQVGRQ